MNTTVWVVLTLGLALLAVSGWRLAKFFERRAMIERCLGLHVTRWLTITENALIRKDEEIRQLKRQLVTLRARKENALIPGDEFSRRRCKAYRNVVRRSHLMEKYWRILLLQIKGNIAKWYIQRTFGNWGAYLRRERAIREIARVKA
jgi:hypothetical protein